MPILSSQFSSRVMRPLLTALVLAGVASGSFAQAAVPDEAADYARPHELIDVDHGRRLNLFCRGSGGPVVIFEAGLESDGWDWLKVHPAVAKLTTACVYDRAGYGFSDTATRPATHAQAVADLHVLLQRAKLKPPYVLVGHSMGGRVAQLYAYTWPKEVGGLVIVDSEHEDEPARGNRVTGGKFSMLLAQEKAIDEGCYRAVRKGMKEGSESYVQCVGDSAELYGPVLWPVVRSARQDLKRQTAVHAEYLQYHTKSAAQLRAARKPFGDLPLVYLTRGVSLYATSGQPRSELDKAFEAEVLKTHEEVVALSSRGVHRVVAGAGHNIPAEKPQAVIDAVAEVLGMR
jgi:pimeloyl-ACP methyl ester carboxylesterase